MKRLSKVTAAADNTEDTRVADKLKQLSDDFDYIQSGIEKMNRASDEFAVNDILAILDELDTGIQNTIETIANKLAE
jgi:hypothetical protein|nr:MAG TPA: hypothetical protein [Bacteriophage sp.]